jgi:hypothetical protein
MLVEEGCSRDAAAIAMLNEEDRSRDAAASTFIAVFCEQMWMEPTKTKHRADQSTVEHKRL